MAGRYVPPALRAAKAAVLTSETGQNSDDAAVEDTARRKLSELAVSPECERPLLTLSEITNHYGRSTRKTTLHDSAKKPDELAYIILFHNSNPRWFKERIIFAKTNLNLLPGHGQSDENTVTEVSSQESQPSSSPPNKSNNARSQAGPTGPIIPVYLETSKKSRSQSAESRSFVFHGYFRLARVDFLKPQSPALVRMLEQKWEVQHGWKAGQTKQRIAEAWAESLRHEWAVVQMGTIPKGEVPGDPEIRRVEGDEGEAEGAGREEKGRGVVGEKDGVEKVGNA